MSRKKMRPFLLFALASYARVSDGKDIVAEEVRTSIVGNDVVVSFARRFEVRDGRPWDESNPTDEYMYY